MSIIRGIKKVFRSRPTIEGAGVHLERVFGWDQVPQLDPFLLLDDFHSDKPADYIKGFPWHPHRGIETITYILQGRVEHGDSIGNSGVISPGDIQWMTAGSGIIHQEMPKGQENGLLWGFQLWANLPASHKMMQPRYRDVKSSTVPEVVTDQGVRIKIISGVVNNVAGQVNEIITEPEYLDVAVPPQTNFSHPAKKGHTVCAYILEGKGYFEQERNPYNYEITSRNWFEHSRESLMGPKNLILFNDGDTVTISTQKEGVRFLLISGKPIREPVAWYGPIVMNTQEELRIAFDEYESGTFLKYQK